MLRQRAAVGPPFSGAFAALGGAFLIFLRLDPGNGLLDVLKCQFKLIRIELFGRAAVLGIAGHAQQMFELLAAGDRVPHLRTIARKACGSEGSSSGSGSSELGAVSVMQR